MKKSTISRRHFLQRSALLAAGASTIGYLPQARARVVGPNEKLNIGLIGAGGRAEDNLRGVSGENIIAMCDVDDERAAKSFAAYPAAKKYRDFRKMLETEKELDAVVVSTPDHMHAPAAIMAMRLGKHVYCEKPLAHSIYERAGCARSRPRLASRRRWASKGTPWKGRGVPSRRSAQA